MKPYTPRTGPVQFFCFLLPSGSEEPRGHEYFHVHNRVRHLFHLHGIFDLEHLQWPQEPQSDHKPDDLDMDGMGNFSRFPPVKKD